MVQSGKAKKTFGTSWKVGNLGWRTGRVDNLWRFVSRIALQMKCLKPKLLGHLKLDWTNTWEWAMLAGKWTRWPKDFFHFYFLWVYGKMSFFSVFSNVFFFFSLLSVFFLLRYIYKFYLQSLKLQQKCHFILLSLVHFKSCLANFSSYKAKLSHHVALWPLLFLNYI